MWQYIIIGLIVVIALLVLVRTIYKVFTGKGCPGCGGSSVCDLSDTCAKSEADEN